MLVVDPDSRWKVKKTFRNMAKYFLRKDVSKKYYWVLRSDENYKIIAKSSESYDSKDGALHSIGWTRANAEKAELKDET